ncbi:MAG TPA: MMPL family transporter, partial [Trueperaceae bacterium]|nr:MMPL family transporter [Trueperaceae bacterium]
LNYHLTGWPAVSHEIQKISKADSLRAEVIGLSISLVILALVFGSIVAATLPLIVAIISIILSLSMLFVIGQFMPITSFGEIIVSLLGLATGIDYALLMVNRFREELLAGLEPKQAAQKTVLTAGKAVLISGLTVLIALSALLVPPLSFIRSLGLTSIVVMFFSVSVSISLMPAIFTLLGSKINLLKITRREPGTRTKKFWANRAENIMKFPWLWTIFGITVLLAISLPALSMQVDVSGVRGLTKETEIRKAQLILEKLKLDSLQRSIDILVDFGDRGFYHPSSIRKIAKLSRAANKIDNVESSFSAMSTQGIPSLLVQQYYATKDLALDSPLSTLVQRTISKDGRYALIRVFPKDGILPSTASTILDKLRSSSKNLGLTTVFGGSYLNDKEFADVLYSSFPLAILLVYFATFILLGLAFKSILIPIKSILLNTLAVSAAFGVITAVFQFGWFAPLFGLEKGLGFIETIVPVFIFSVIFGLSMDYEVFLVSRIYEGHKQGLSDKEAVKQALSATGSVISSASLIMIVVFMVFIASRVVLIKTLSLGLSVAILLDATLVRSTLVPAIMSLAGNWNWYMPKIFIKFADKINLSHD